MKVKFRLDADTMNYGRVKKDEEVDVSKEDGQIFIKSGIAKKLKEDK